MEKNDYLKKGLKEAEELKIPILLVKSLLKILSVLTQKPCSFALLVFVCLWGWGWLLCSSEKKTKAMPYIRNREHKCPPSQMCLYQSRTPEVPTWFILSLTLSKQKIIQG